MPVHVKDVGVHRQLGLGQRRDLHACDSVVEQVTPLGPADAQHVAAWHRLAPSDGCKVSERCGVGRSMAEKVRVCVPCAPNALRGRASCRARCHPAAASSLTGGRIGPVPAGTKAWRGILGPVALAGSRTAVGLEPRQLWGYVRGGWANTKRLWCNPVVDKDGAVGIAKGSPPRCADEAHSAMLWLIVDHPGLVLAAVHVLSGVQVVKRANGAKQVAAVWRTKAP